MFFKVFRRRRVTRRNGLTVGIFHPYCNSGGGGEKVLWCAIRAIQQQHASVDIVVYTGDIYATPDDILVLAAKRLNTSLPRPVKFIYLKSRTFVEAKWYPVCTLLGQSIGSVILGLEAIWRYLPGEMNWFFYISKGYQTNFKIKKPQKAMSNINKPDLLPI